MIRSMPQVNRQVPVRKVRRMLDYMARIDLDLDTAVSATGMNLAQLQTLGDDDLVPAAVFSRIYSIAVKQMQLLRKPIPWAAGIGSDAFEMMCHSIISSKTLSEALERAERFDKLLYPLLGYKMNVRRDGSNFELHYHVRTQSSEEVFAPEHWNWAQHFDTVAHVSGMTVWYKFCAWLIGQNFELAEMHVAEPYVSASYEKGVSEVFGCPVHFDSKQTCIRASIDVLERRLVHSPDSLQRFLENSVYELIATSERPASTSAAIRSLIAREFDKGMPSFKEMASFLHCSESSLRRRLQQENTNYQEIKDQLRCDFAVDHLRNRDTRINELAEILGFAEPSSFVRSFRSWVGMTPSEYRERHADACETKLVV